MKGKEIIQIDVNTGEQMDGVTAWIPQKYYFPQNHLTMFQDALKIIASLNLSKDEYRIFNLLIAEAGMGNLIAIPINDISKALKLDRSQVSRAIKGLADRNIIIKGEQKMGRTPSLRINYGLAWKGKIKDYKINRHADPEINTNPKSKQIELFKENGQPHEQWKRDKDYVNFKNTNK